MAVIGVEVSIVGWKYGFFGIFGKTLGFFGKFKKHLWNFWVFWKFSWVWPVSILRTALAATHRHGELYTINYGNNLQKKANVYVNISSNSWVASRFATGSTCCFSCRALLGFFFGCNRFQLCRQGATWKHDGILSCVWVSVSVLLVSLCLVC